MLLTSPKGHSQVAHSRPNIPSPANISSQVPKKPKIRHQALGRKSSTLSSASHSPLWPSLGQVEVMKEPGDAGEVQELILKDKSSCLKARLRWAFESPWKKPRSLYMPQLVALKDLVQPRGRTKSTWAIGL